MRDLELQFRGLRVEHHPHPRDVAAAEDPDR
jgi:hypothetical protein